MGPFLAALVYTWISHGMAFVLMPWSLSLNLRIRAILLWAFAAAVLYLLHDWFAVLMVIAAATALLAPAGPISRASFFLVAAPCLPTYLVTQMPFPGLNYLLELTQYKVASVVLLLPLLFMRRYGALRRANLSGLDLCFLFFIAYTATIIAIAVNTTAGLRHFVDLMLAFMLPYYVLRYAIQKIEDVETYFKAFVVVSIILASITLVSTAKQWDFYKLLQPVSTFSIPDFRAGYVRIEAVANTHSLAYHLVAAVLILEYLKVQMSIRWVHLMALRFVFLAAAVFTNSHGAFVGCAVGFVAYRIFLIRSNMLRNVIMVYVIMATVVAGLWLLYGATDSVDKYGTVGYRQELFRIGFNYVLQVPIFGNYDFYLVPVFEPLRQGQGIIDVTNLYLQILLHYGFMGGVPFFAVMVAPVVALLVMVFKLNAKAANGSKKQPAHGEARRIMPAYLPATMGRRRTVETDASVERWKRMAAVLVGIQAGWLVFVATTSHVALTVHLGLVFAAFSRGLADLGMAAATSEQAPKNDEAKTAIRPRLGGLLPAWHKVGRSAP